jgi:lysylphosphatidylglycerol synthetase-like protein (DUF2156 family)
MTPQRHRRPLRPRWALAPLHATITALTLAAAAVHLWLARTEERARATRSDAGYTTETMLVTAVLIVLAGLVLAILRNKILDMVNGIQL